MSSPGEDSAAVGRPRRVLNCFSVLLGAPNLKSPKCHTICFSTNESFKNHRPSTCGCLRYGSTWGFRVGCGEALLPEYSKRLYSGPYSMGWPSSFVGRWGIVFCLLLEEDTQKHILSPYKAGEVTQQPCSWTGTRCPGSWEHYLEQQSAVSLKILTFKIQ